MCITLDFKSCRFTDEVAKPRTLSEICRICNIPDSHLVKRFLQERSFLLHTWYTQDVTKLVLTYSAPLQLRNFFFDPGRSRHLYSAPWVIERCWEAVQGVIKSQSNLVGDPVLSFQFAFGLCHFFTPKKDCQFSSASLMLSAESIRNGSDSDSLLGFLKFLSRIPWLDICFNGHLNGLWTPAIANWVCKSLVSEHVPNCDH